MLAGVLGALGGSDIHGVEIADLNNRRRTVCHMLLPCLADGTQPSTSHVTRADGLRGAMTSPLLARATRCRRACRSRARRTAVFHAFRVVRRGGSGACSLRRIWPRLSRRTMPETEDGAYAVTPFWYVEDSKGSAFVDFQNDVSLKDIKLSHREGFRSVEHLKRYTTLGMATDQGKTANVPGRDHGGADWQVDSRNRNHHLQTTVLASCHRCVWGRSAGMEFRPTRLTPSHDWAAEQGAVFVETGASCARSGIRSKAKNTGAKVLTAR